MPTPIVRTGCVLVHNGIIENYQPLKQQLQKEGYKFQSGDGHGSGRSSDRQAYAAGA